MGQFCDFCGEQRSMIYCSSDAAFLCLSCDRNIHSANALSRRHSRTLVCERCNCHPAVVRCIEEIISLCQTCDWSIHDAPESRTGHKRQTINCYSGCPSSAELSRIWSFFSVDFSSSKLQEGSSSLDKEDKNPSRCPLLSFDHTEEAAMDPMASDIDQFSGSRTSDPLNEKVQFPCIPAVLAVFWLMGDKFREGMQPILGSILTENKANLSRVKHLGSLHDDILHIDFNNSDIDLNWENCGILFGKSFDEPQLFVEDGGMDSLFDVGNIFDTEFDAESIPIAKACKFSSDSIASWKSDPNICFPRAAAAPSTLSLSFSGFTNESSTGDHQECGVSSMPSTGETPFDVPCGENQFLAATRNSAVLRYKEKKKSRRFDKKIRYASRKATADSRKRVKGRFVKPGDPYDYDPSHLTRGQCLYATRNGVL